MKQELFVCHVAGLQYTKYQLVDKQLKPNAKLKLVGEPSNPHDPRAIRVMCGSTKVGYIPRTQTEACWDAHDDGARLEAEVVSYNRENPSWQKLVIAVSAVFPKNAKKKTGNEDVEL